MAEAGSYKTGGGSTAGIDAAALVGTQAIQSVEKILVELLRASAANPIVAATAMIIITDILASKKVISDDAARNISIFIGTLSAADVALGILKPSVQTLVYGSEGGGIPASLLSLLTKAPVV